MALILKSEGTGSEGTLPGAWWGHWRKGSEG